MRRGPRWRATTTLAGASFVFAIAAAAPVAAAGPADGLPAARPDDAFMEGVALGLHFGKGQSYAPYLWEIATTGADTVSLVFHWEQHDVRASTLRPAADTPSDAEIGAAIDAARSLGLDVLVFPIVQITERAPGEWRGVLEPGDRDAWFASYREFILRYAALASDHGAEIFSVGSELGSMEADGDRWRALVADVRAVYGGRVLYSANWDAYFGTPFWDAVDVAGLTGYFELSADPSSNPSPEALDRAWAPFVEALRTFAAGVGRPVVITEVGYVSQTGAAYHPWDYTATGAVDLQAQVELYRAAYRALGSQAWLGGVFIWNWFGDGGSGDDGYTPRQKPAEQVVRHWYGGASSGAR